jgi:PIN domain nuclease of toxin-antitoxin system
VRLLLDTHAFLRFITKDPELGPCLIIIATSFDRMPVAQAKVEKISIVSIDAIADLYGIKRLW